MRTENRFSPYPPINTDSYYPPADAFLRRLESAHERPDNAFVTWVLHELATQVPLAKLYRTVEQKIAKQRQAGKKEISIELACHKYIQKRLIDLCSFYFCDFTLERGGVFNTQEAEQGQAYVTTYDETMAITRAISQEPTFKNDASGRPLRLSDDELRQLNEVTPRGYHVVLHDDELQVRGIIDYAIGYFDVEDKPSPLFAIKKSKLRYERIMREVRDGIGDGRCINELFLRRNYVTFISLAPKPTIYYVVSEDPNIGGNPIETNDLRNVCLLPFPVEMEWLHYLIEDVLSEIYHADTSKNTDP